MEFQIWWIYLFNLPYCVINQLNAEEYLYVQSFVSCLVYCKLAGLHPRKYCPVVLHLLCFEMGMLHSYIHCYYPRFGFWNWCVFYLEVIFSSCHVTCDNCNIIISTIDHISIAVGSKHNYSSSNTCKDKKQFGKEGELGRNK